jgi:hypothetical protein
MVLCNRHGLRLAVCGTGGGEDESFHIRFNQSVEQSEAAFNIVLKVKGRLADRFTDIRQRGKMDARFNVVLGCDALKELPITNISFVKRGLRRYGRAMTT